MNDALVSAKMVDGQRANKQQVQKVFQSMYKSQLELVIKYGLDEKKKEQLRTELDKDIKR